MIFYAFNSNQILTAKSELKISNGAIRVGYVVSP